MEKSAVVNQCCDSEDEMFLRILHNDRSIFLDRLQDLGLLPSFLEAESETTKES